MKFLAFALSLFLITFSLSADQRLLYTNGGGKIEVYRIDPETGIPERIQSVPGAGRFAISSDKTRLYRLGDQELERFSIQEDGTLESLAVHPTTAKGGYVAIDATDQYLAVSDYAGAAARMITIPEGHDAEALETSVKLEKAAHSAVFAPGNRFLLVPATTPNKVFQLTFDDATGALAKNDPPFAEGPEEEGSARQPRYLVFHPTLPIVYTTQEREVPGVAAWTWDEGAGTLELLEAIPTTPEGFAGTLTNAALAITPDGRFLYLTSRDLTERGSVVGESTVVGFRVDTNSGKLTLIGHTPCPQIPKAVVIDETGEFLYAAGDAAETLAAYRISSETGALIQVAEIDAGNVTWLKCISLSE